MGGGKKPLRILCSLISFFFFFFVFSPDASCFWFDFSLGRTCRSFKHALFTQAVDQRTLHSFYTSCLKVVLPHPPIFISFAISRSLHFVFRVVDAVHVPASLPIPVHSPIFYFLIDLCNATTTRTRCCIQLVLCTINPTV